VVEIILDITVQHRGAVIHVDIVVDFRRTYATLMLMSFVERDPSYCSLALLCYSNGFVLYFRCKNIHDLRHIIIGSLVH